MRLDIDQFGHDPQVRFLRRAFASMETIQNDLLKELNISSFDERLRRIRLAALNLFEKVWVSYSRWGVSIDEKEMSDIYLHCLAHTLAANNINLPKGLFYPNERIQNIIKEVSK
ncbi:MAG: hypothetical protein BWX58_00080 [Deltaproteobacteria bacterium ADurb.Bin026]|jgi:hypothetical protein|nr:MAG: hypothetical protein BWX58_00080 [Deltaproteobacteria bacterium ADurb.Bin026]HOS60144.1 hypothetical protein [Syntrophorhabdaceae bacterium]